MDEAYILKLQEEILYLHSLLDEKRRSSSFLCFTEELTCMRIEVLSKLLGHSSIIATEKTYARFLRNTMDDEIRKMVEIWHRRK